MKSSCASQNGAALVEFALVLPILLILTFGIVEFGFILYNKATITNASREGARTGIVYRTYDSSNISSAPPGTKIGDKIPPGSALITNIIQQRVWQYVGQTNASSSATRMISFGNSKSVGLLITPSVQNGDQVLTVRTTYNYDYLVLPGFLTILPQPMVLVSETTMRFEG